MASKILVLCSSCDGPDVVQSVAIDASKLGLVTRDDQLASDILRDIVDSTPSERKRSGIPGCAVDSGHFVTDAARDECGESERTFRDVVWEDVDEGTIREFTIDHHCIVLKALSDE